STEIPARPHATIREKESHVDADRSPESRVPWGLLPCLVRSRDAGDRPPGERDRVAAPRGGGGGAPASRRSADRGRPAPLLGAPAFGREPFGREPGESGEGTGGHGAGGGLDRAAHRPPGGAGPAALALRRSRCGH